MNEGGSEAWKGGIVTVSVCRVSAEVCLPLCGRASTPMKSMTGVSPVGLHKHDRCEPSGFT